jgi:hypothetical protein
MARLTKLLFENQFYSACTFNNPKSGAVELIVQSKHKNTGNRLIGETVKSWVDAFTSTDDAKEKHALCKAIAE